MQEIDNKPKEEEKPLVVPIKNPGQTTTSFKLPKNKKFNEEVIIFDSNFDSGNCKSVTQLSDTQYQIEIAKDCEGRFDRTNSKSWFYFTYEGFPVDTKLRKELKIFRPCIKVGKRPWSRIPKPVGMTFNGHSHHRCTEIKFTIKVSARKGEKTAVALIFPYSYSECQQFVEKLEENFKDDPFIYFNKQVLIKSPEGRNIDILTISSKDSMKNEVDIPLLDGLFPNKKREKQAQKFSNNKYVVFISARVHPGETPSSYAMKGILNFLLNKNDIRAKILRKHFVFKLIPMINPDGVYHGHYRMDILNQNLNRYYNNPDKKRQPAIYAIIEILNHITLDRKLFFYCDLHAHGGRKGCFLYGNAFSDFLQQVESQLYAKVLQLNDMNFEYQYCNFSLKHMNCRDYNENRNKDGCGRVQIFKRFNLIHSYTLECGYHSVNTLNRIVKLQNLYKKQMELGLLTENRTSDIESGLYKYGSPYFTTEIYENLGKSLVVSLLDIIKKNPLSRIPHTQHKSISHLRKHLAEKIQKYDKFGRLSKFENMNMISQQIEERIYRQLKTDVFGMKLPPPTYVVTKKTVPECIAKQLEKEQSQQNSLQLQSNRFLKTKQRIIQTQDQNNSQKRMLSLKQFPQQEKYIPQKINTLPQEIIPTKEKFQKRQRSTTPKQTQLKNRIRSNDQKEKKIKRSQKVEKSRFLPKIVQSKIQKMAKSNKILHKKKNNYINHSTRKKQIINYFSKSNYSNVDIQFYRQYCKQQLQNEIKKKKAKLKTISTPQKN